MATIPKTDAITDPFIGCSPIPGYMLVRQVGAGRIGSVYEARREEPDDRLACKIIPAAKLRKGWERELQKLTKLRTVPHVVQYHNHGTFLVDRQRRLYG